jgi:hypothetical protein
MDNFYNSQAEDPHKLGNTGDSDYLVLKMGTYRSTHSKDHNGDNLLAESQQSLAEYTLAETFLSKNAWFF